MQLAPGDAIGPYHILSMLGSGGMGTVYLAEDRRLGRHVALKFLHADGDSADEGRRLLREARTASALNHPNICQIFDVGGEGRASWIAMEYVHGRPLSASLPAGGLPPDAAVRIVTKVAGAVAHAHQRGILHRDLKPANIVCDDEGQPKILDFGISSRLPEFAARDATHTGTALVGESMAGSLPYMAPEILRGAPPDERADLWSLGVLLYELLTGTLPFRDTGAMALAAAILDGRVTPLPSNVPPPLARIVMRLLAPHPGDRYKSAAEVVAALDAVSTPIAAERPAVRRYGLVAAGVIVIVAAGAYLLWSTTRFRPLGLSGQRLVSTAEASHRAPSFSPDGSMVAMVAPGSEGVGQIHVANLAQRTSIQITSGNVPASRPRWSPKGDQIVYAVAGEGVWSVSPIGGAPTRILSSGFNPNFSADGARLVFEDETSGPGRGSIWTAAADGTDIKEVAGTPPLYYPLPRGPAFSPDGSQIAFFQAEAGPMGDLWVIPSAGGTARRLTTDTRDGGWPIWTRDGRAIIYSSARAGSRTLWQVPANGGEPVALTTGAGEDDEPDISADGRHVTYTNVRNTWDLRVRDLRGGTERSLLQRGVEMVFPMFSPDGTRLTFFGRSDYAVAIFTIGADGSDLRQLTGERELNHHPRWSADGNDVFFFQLGPEHSFRRVPAPGGPSAAFRPWEWSEQNAPYFDPSGRFITYLHQRPLGAPSTVTEHTVIHDVATGQERRCGAHVHPHGWSQDSASIVGWRHDGNVVICRVADESCRVVTQGSSPVWPLGGERVYFARPANSSLPQELWSAALDGSDERREAALGLFAPLGRFFAASTERAAWAAFNPGRHEVWTATVR